jgi:hypothetical protein
MLSFIQGIHLVVSLMLLYILLKYYTTLNRFVDNINKNGFKTCGNQSEESEESDYYS